MRTFRFLAPFLAVALMSAVPFAHAQTGVEERDSHYRAGPNAPYHHYKNYRPPMVYYPRRPQDVEKPKAPPRAEMRDPGGSRAPQYGAPPSALERIPRP